MGIVDDIRQGADDARRQMELEQEQAAEEDRRNAERVRVVKDLWQYLNRYRQAMRNSYRPKVISCVRKKLFNHGYKTVERDAWPIKTEHRGYDTAGNRLVYRLWLDNDSDEMWWEQPGGPTHLITLGVANPHLSAESDHSLREAEKDLPSALGALAARHGIDLLNSGG